MVGLAWLKKRESAPSAPAKAEIEIAEGTEVREGEELTRLEMPMRDSKKEAAAAARKQKKASAAAQTEKFGGILADDMGLGKTVQMSTSSAALE